MPSNYAAFDVTVEDTAGVQTLVGSGVVLKIRADGAGSDLTTVTTNSIGHIAAGTVSVAAGTKIHFRGENYNGMAASVSQVTT